MIIGDAEIPDAPEDFNDRQRWIAEELIPACYAMSKDPRLEHMGFAGRPLKSLEMFGMSLAKHQSPMAIAENWIKEFEALLEKQNDSAC